MKKPGHWTRRKLREQRRDVVRENWALILKITAAYAAAAVIAYAIQRPSVRPWVGGGLTVGFLWLITWILTAMDGSHGSRMGVHAERWTAQEFRALRRYGWHIIHGIAFKDTGAAYDVDHVAVGPGGVLALETKWTSFRWRVTATGLDGPLRDPVMQARLGAVKIGKLLASNDVNIPVVPGVVLWGPGAPTDLDGGARRVGDVIVLSGRHADEWRGELEERRLGQAEIEAVREVLQRHSEGQLLHERRTRRRDPGKSRKRRSAHVSR